jgi:hypothetical protein
MARLGEKAGMDAKALGVTKTEEMVAYPDNINIKLNLWRSSVGAPYVSVKGMFFPYFEDDEVSEAPLTVEPIAAPKMDTKPPETKKEEAKAVQVVSTIPQTLEQKPTSKLPAIMHGVDMMVDVDQAEKEWKNYLDLTKRIIDDSDYQSVGVGPTAKKFKKKSAWRKYARFFNITDEIVKQDIIRDPKNPTLIIEVITWVAAHAPNGRTSTGIGGCSASERRFSHQNHDILSTSHTRAKSRAISDLIGSGEPSAEEIEDTTD